MTPLVDLDRHVGVQRYTDLFPFMTLAWQKHFERTEWLGSIGLASNHVRVSDDFLQDAPQSDGNFNDAGSMSLLLPHQGLTINGWADTVAAAAFVEAVNAYGQQHWTSETSKAAIVVSPHDPEWSGAEIRRRGSTAGAVAIPLTTDMLGSKRWNPVYEACLEAGLPVLVHFSGIEGNYSGAAGLAGGVHSSAFARMALMPHLAESTIASLTFEGAFSRFPDLQFLFSGFGFTWLPSLMWRLDREWRTFRHDIPWVTEPPSHRVLGNMWFTTWPVGEASDIEVWDESFNENLRSRITFGSHAPHDGDGAQDVVRILGAEWAARLEGNGQAFLRQNSKVRA